MRKILYPIAVALLAIICQTMTSCLDNETDIDYTSWRKENDAFFAEMAAKVDENGNPEYEKYSPDWAPGITLLIKRHRTSDANAMRPMDNSLCDVVYRGKLYNETAFDSSYTKKDSIYQCRPMDNVTGFWASLTTMAKGDSITVIIPSNAAYGKAGTTGIPPYSVLIFDLKLKKIASWDSPMQ